MNHSTAVDLDEIPSPASVRSEELLALYDALRHLEQIDGRKARVVELRFFGGLTVEEAAESVTGLTSNRDARLAAG